MTDTHDPLRNHILAALTKDARQRVMPKLTKVEMSLGDVIY